jgi:hypothetical protein
VVIVTGSTSADGYCEAIGDEGVNDGAADVAGCLNGKVVPVTWLSTMLGLQGSGRDWPTPRTIISESLSFWRYVREARDSSEGCGGRSRSSGALLHSLRSMEVIWEIFIPSTLQDVSCDWLLFRVWT